MSGCGREKSPLKFDRGEKSGIEFRAPLDVVGKTDQSMNCDARRGSGGVEKVSLS
jgi:hypothetical protein